MLELDLSDNSLFGSIAPDWKLPAGMQVLLLAGNRLNGSIPTAWSLPSNLTDLNLADNQVRLALLCPALLLVEWGVWAELCVCRSWKRNRLCTMLLSGGNVDWGRCFVF